MPSVPNCTVDKLPSSPTGHHFYSQGKTRPLICLQKLSGHLQEGCHLLDPYTLGGPKAKTPVCICIYVSQTKGRCPICPPGVPSAPAPMSGLVPEAMVQIPSAPQLKAIAFTEDILVWYLGSPLTTDPAASWQHFYQLPFNVLYLPVTSQAFFTCVPLLFILLLPPDKDLLGARYLSP
jgi:hypothetical protein